MIPAKDQPAEPSPSPAAAGLQPPGGAGRQAPASAGPERALRSFESAELFAGAREVAIQHRGREYRLRITQNGKLILNA